MDKSLLIIGAGGHGRVCAEAAEAAGWSVAAFFDDAVKGGRPINGIAVATVAMKELHTEYPPETHALFIAIGNNNDRRAHFEYGQSLGYVLPVIRHPSAQISPTAAIGDGTVILANAVVSANAHIGRYCILNNSCSVDHDNVLDDGTQICPGAHLAGNVNCGRLAFIGTGAAIIPGRQIGDGAVVGAGSLVAADVPHGLRVMGNPAKPIGE